MDFKRSNFRLCYIGGFFTAPILCSRQGPTSGRAAALIEKGFGFRRSAVESENGVSLCRFTLCFFPFSDSTLPTTAVLFHFFGVPVTCHRFRSSDMSLFSKLKHV